MVNKPGFFFTVEASTVVPLTRLKRCGMMTQLLAPLLVPSLCEGYGFELCLHMLRIRYVRMIFKAEIWTVQYWSLLIKVCEIVSTSHHTHPCVT